MTKKFCTFLLVALMSVSLVIPGITCEAKSSGGGRSTSGFSRSVSKAPSAPKASAPKSNTSGFKNKNSSSSSAPKGSSYTTKDGAKVTSGGGNTSGFKSKQTQTKEKATENMAKKDTSKSNSHWYGGTNNHYYGGGYNDGFGHFATGMVFGSLLSSPWHVYAGAPGYVGGYGGTTMAPAAGYYSPFSGFIGLIIWLIEWAIIIAILYYAYRYFKKWYRNRKQNNTSGFRR